MKKSLYIFLLLYSMSFFAQRKEQQRTTEDIHVIEINSDGLDNLLLENIDSNRVKVILESKNYDNQLINLSKKADALQVSFDFEGFETREVIFKKHIAKRQQTANAIIQVPKNKNVVVYGKNIDITALNIQNELKIFIENGILKLNTIRENTTVYLYSGNVFASVKGLNINVISSSGKITYNKNSFFEQLIKTDKLNLKSLKIKTIKANIFLSDY